MHGLSAESPIELFVMRLRADDLLQEIFLLVLRLCHTFDPTKSSARFCILQMTHRRAISRWRYLMSQHFYNWLELDEASKTAPHVRSKIASHNGSLEQLIARDLVRQILPALSEDQRKAMQLYFLMA